jgi:hypothetical protein
MNAQVIFLFARIRTKRRIGNKNVNLRVSWQADIGRQVNLSFRLPESYDPKVTPVNLWILNPK